jgi:protein phosphatase
VAFNPPVAAPVACPQCRQINRPGALYCVTCGTPLVAAAQITASLISERDQVRRAARHKAEVCPRLEPGERGPNWQAFGLSSVGRVRVNNEDSVLVSPLRGGGWLLIVADGMGGAEAGEVASATSAVLVRELIENHLTAHPRPASDHRSQLAQAGEAANAAIFGRARAQPELRGMGCTLTVALVQGYCLELAHVGDSRAYHLSADRHFQQLTLDHTIVEHMLRQGYITPEEAREHPLRNQLYRAVGTDAALEVDTYIEALQPTDRLLLCSDGLTLHCADDEIAGILASARSPETAARALVGRALDYGAEDNVSVAVLMVA